MRTASTARTLCAALLITLPCLSQADGLTTTPASLGGAHWQTRMEFDNTAPRPVGSPFNVGLGVSQQTARLFSDYQLDTLRLGHTGGLRLTSGLLFSQRSGNLAPDAEARSAWPYLGIGYSGSGVHGDWGFSADIGMAAQSLGATARLGRVLGGSFSLSDAVRDLRLQPVVRLGVNYSF